jgi:hypothetical protein
MDDDDDKPIPHEELSLACGFKRRTLYNKYQKGEPALYNIQGTLYCTRRQVKEMIEKCRVQKKKPDSSGKSRSAVAEVSGLSETERVERARASIRSTLQQSRKPKHSQAMRPDTIKPPRG